MVRLPKKQIDQTSDLLKVISGSFRLEIICLLCKQGSLSVNELAKELSAEQSATSHQLAKLRAEKIVTTSRHGQTIKYELAKNNRSKLATKIINECGCLRSK